jgi:hypothetical protein
MKAIIKFLTEDTMRMIVLIILLFWLFQIQERVKRIDRSLKNTIERVITK